MRIGLVMDASCDLPQDYVTRHRITVLPLAIAADGTTFTDRCDAREIQRFLDDVPAGQHGGAQVEPATPDAIQALILDGLVVQYDCVFCLTAAASRGPIHANATKASFGVLKNYRSAREDAGRQGPFLLRVIDTQNVAAGAAVVVAEAVHVIDADQGPAQIRERLTTISRNVHGYQISREGGPARSRAGAHRGGLLGATLASAFNMTPILRTWRGETRAVGRARGFEAGAQALFMHTAERIQDGLMVPTVCVSYAGPLFDLRALPGYDALTEVCDSSGVELISSPMSISGMVALGDGALAVGFAYGEYTPSF